MEGEETRRAVKVLVRDSKWGGVKLFEFALLPKSKIVALHLIKFLVNFDISVTIQCPSGMKREQGATICSEQ